VDVSGFWLYGGDLNFGASARRFGSIARRSG